jgi:DNA-binding MarR family transcriptional regulator
VEVSLPTPDEYRQAAAFRAEVRTFLRNSEEAARRNGLTPQRYLLLLMIKGAVDGTERSTVTDLCQRLKLGQSTVTELVGRAHDVGLLERSSDANDGRVAHLYLTVEGENRVSSVVMELRGDRDRLVSMFADASPL